MDSASSEISRKPNRHGPYRLPYFAVSGSISSLFFRLNWECQDRRSPTLSYTTGDA